MEVCQRARKERTAVADQAPALLNNHDPPERHVLHRRPEKEAHIRQLNPHKDAWVRARRQVVVAKRLVRDIENHADDRPGNGLDHDGRDFCAHHTLQDGDLHHRICASAPPRTRENDCT